MNKKTILILAFSLITTLTAIGLTTAQESTYNEIDNLTLNEMQIIHEEQGAKIRLLQLEYHIRWQIMRAETIILLIKQKNGNYTELETIIEEMKIIADEIKEYRNNINTNFDKNQTVQKFLNWKYDAKQLIKEFKENSKRQINQQDKRVLQEQLALLKNDSLGQLKQEIERKKREFNSEQIARILNKENLSNRELIDKVKTGEIKKDEAIQQLREKILSLPAEEKAKIRERIRESLHERIEWREKKAEDLSRRSEHLTNISERIRERALIMQQKGKLNASTILQTRASAIETRANILANRSNQIREKAAQQNNNIRTTNTN